MSVKASVSISDQQSAFARQLVRDGRYASLSDVVRRGLELVRAEIESGDSELDALQALLDERMSGEFITIEQGRADTEAMIAVKRAAHCL